METINAHSISIPVSLPVVVISTQSLAERRAVGRAGGQVWFRLPAVLLGRLGSKQVALVSPLLMSSPGKGIMKVPLSVESVAVAFWTCHPGAAFSLHQKDSLGLSPKVLQAGQICAVVLFCFNQTLTLKRLIRSQRVSNSQKMNFSAWSPLASLREKTSKDHLSTSYRSGQKERIHQLVATYICLPTLGLACSPNLVIHNLRL